MELLYLLVILLTLATWGVQSVRARIQYTRECTEFWLVLLANVQSIRNKLDELQANVHHAREFRDVYVMPFTETWLADQTVLWN